MVSGRVSVIIPTRNRASLLSETLESAKLQSHHDVEIIVVDDASTDDTESVVARHAGSDSRIKYERLTEHRGAPFARNLGTSQSSGEYIQFLDSDDVLHREKFRVQTVLLQASPEFDFAVCQTCFFQKKTGDSKLIWNKLEGDPLLRFMRHDMVWVTVAPLWRKSSLERFGGHDEALKSSQDFEHHTRCMILGARPLLHRHLLAYYRVHDGPTIGTEAVSTREETHLKVFKSFQLLLHETRALNSELLEELVQDFLWVAYRASLVGKVVVQLEAIGAAITIDADCDRLARASELRELISSGTHGLALLDKYQSLGFDRSIREDWWAKYTLSDEPVEPLPAVSRYGRRMQDGARG